MEKYIILDSRNLKEEFISRSLHPPQLVITSPPYFNLKNYEGNGKQIGYGQTYEMYLIDVVSVLQKCYEIARKNASLWIIVDTFRKDGETIPLPFYLISKLKELFGEQTWRLKDIVIWHKNKNIPWHSEGRFRNHFEYILFFTKSDKFKFDIDSLRETKDYKKWWLAYPERYNSNGKTLTNVWSHSAPIRGWGKSRQNHFCPLPFLLIEKIITIGSKKGDVVFDPFAGSGSVIALANEMKRIGYGFDINKKYKDRFMTEVTIAAKKYWERRKMVKENENKVNRNFRTQNLKLRKLKSASLIHQYLKTKIIATTPHYSSNRLKLIIELPDKKNKYVKNVLEKNVSDIERKMKTLIEYHLLTPRGFRSKLKNKKKWIAYDTEKFYNKIGTYPSLSAYNVKGIITNINITLPSNK